MLAGYCFAHRDTGEIVVLVLLPACEGLECVASGRCLRRATPHARICACSWLRHDPVCDLWFIGTWDGARPARSTTRAMRCWSTCFKVFVFKVSDCNSYLQGDIAVHLISSMPATFNDPACSAISAAVPPAVIQAHGRILDTATSSPARQLAALRASGARKRRGQRFQRLSR